MEDRGTHGDRGSQRSLNQRSQYPYRLLEQERQRHQLTIKEIKDNRYHWQWRDGDTVMSKYKEPINPDE